MKIATLILLQITALTGVLLSCKDNSAADSTAEETEGSQDLKVYDPVRNLTSRQLNREIDRTVIPSVRLTDATFQGGIGYVMQVGSELHPVEPLQFPFDVRAEVSEDLRVSLSGTEVPYRQLISLFCVEAGVKWRVEEGVIVIENQ